MLIRLGDAFFELEHIAVVRASPLNKKKQSIIFPLGASALDGGFLIDCPIDDVLETIAQARMDAIAYELARVEDANSTISHPPAHPDPELDDQ